MEEVSKGCQAFVKDNQLNNKGYILFDKIVKKAAKPKTKKPHDSK